VQQNQSISVIRDLASLEEITDSSGYPWRSSPQPRVNSHVHLPPNFSAFCNVKQAVNLAVAQGVGVVGVSNYYDFSVYEEFTELARTNGIFPLFGLEIIALIDELVVAGVKINDPGNPGKMYICGKGITHFVEMTSRARELINTIRSNDSRRMKEMTQKLQEVFNNQSLDMGLDESKIIDMVTLRHNCDRKTVYLQERHLAQAFQETFFEKVPVGDRITKLSEVFGVTPKADAEDAVKIQGEIRSHLMKAGKSCFVRETFLDFAQAYELILQLGGIPCYPTLADGTSPICDFEQPVGKLIDSLQQNNIHCVELIPIRNQPDVLSHYAKAIRSAGFIVVGGTEHNTLDLLPIEPTCIDGAAVPEDIKEIFVEGAYVVAAHQFLTLNGECGFVDSVGKPNPAYETAASRIEAFANMGADIIRRYYKTNIEL